MTRACHTHLGYCPTMYMIFEAMMALLSFPLFCSHSPKRSLMTITKNFFSSSSGIAPLMLPTAQHKVFRLRHDHSDPFTCQNNHGEKHWIWSSLQTRRAFPRVRYWRLSFQGSKNMCIMSKRSPWRARSSCITIFSWVGYYSRNPHQNNLPSSYAIAD